MQIPKAMDKFGDIKGNSSNSTYNLELSNKQAHKVLNCQVLIVCFL